MACVLWFESQRMGIEYRGDGTFNLLRHIITFSHFRYISAINRANLLLTHMVLAEVWFITFVNFLAYCMFLVPSRLDVTCINPQNRTCMFTHDFECPPYVCLCVGMTERGESWPKSRKTRVNEAQSWERSGPGSPIVIKFALFSSWKPYMCWFLHPFGGYAELAQDAQEKS